MRTALTFFALLAICFSANANLPGDGDINQPLMNTYYRVTLSKGNLYYERCQLGQNLCEVYGNPSGYRAQEIQFSPNLRKAITVGATVAAPVAILYGSFFAAAWLIPYGTLSGVALAAAESSIYEGIILLSAGTALGAAALIDQVNPVYQWQKANILGRLDSRAMVEGESRAIAFRTANQLKTFEKVLNEVLGLPASQTPIEEIPGFEGLVMP
jgi:hypothetical protein